METTKRGGKRPNAGAKPKQEAEKVKPITIYAKNKLIDHYGSDLIKTQLQTEIKRLELMMQLETNNLLTLNN